MTKPGTTATFAYNANGLRIRKTVNGVDTNYTLHGKNIVHMTQGANNLHFWYDAQNRPAIVQFNGEKYGYVVNLQGDIVGLIDSAGTEVVKYAYDAWGKILSTTGALASTLGSIQPFRYRSYVYDQETGLYYLRSRYYYSTWNRFINLDIAMTINRFRYSLNNAVNYFDPTGTVAETHDPIQDSNIEEPNLYERLPEGKYLLNVVDYITVKRILVCEIYLIDYDDHFVRNILDISSGKKSIFDFLIGEVKSSIAEAASAWSSVGSLLAGAISLIQSNAQKENFYNAASLAEEKKSGLLVMISREYTWYWPFGVEITNYESITFYEYNQFIEENLDNFSSIATPISQ